ETGDAIEAGHLGQVASDLDVRIRPPLLPPEELQDEPISINDRRVALLGRTAADRERWVRHRNFTPNFSAARSDLTQRQKRGAERIILQRIEQCSVANQEG